MPFTTAQRDALIRGLPIVKGLRPKAEEQEGQDDTMSQVRQQKQTVLSPIAAVPAAKVVAGLKRASNTRASSSTDAEEAAGREKATQEKAASKAKRQREQDVSTAIAKATKPPKKGAAGMSNPGAAAPQDEEDPRVDLSFLSNEGESEEH